MNTPALSTLGRAADGEMNGMVFFHVQLIGILEYVGIQWSKEQVAKCAKTAYNEYYYFTLAELKQFFTRMEAGHYNSNKNMMPPVFMSFLKEYAEEMETERYNYFSVEAQKPKWTPPAEPVSDELFNAKMEEIINMLAPPEEKTIADKLGGEDAFEAAKQEALKKAETLGVNFNQDQNQ